MRQSLVPAVSDPTCTVTDAGGGRSGNVVGDLGSQQRAHGVVGTFAEQLARRLAVFGRRVRLQKRRTRQQLVLGTRPSLKVGDQVKVRVEGVSAFTMREYR